MGRKKSKNKNKQQQPAFRPRQPQTPKVLTSRTTKLPAYSNVASVSGMVFQAPHHQQEAMVELSDDTSPNTPLPSTAGWKPIQSGIAGKNTTSPEIKITRQQQIWHEFKESIAKPIYKIGEKKIPEEPKKQEETSKQTVTKSQTPQTGDEIRWELNVLDEKEDVIEISDDPDITPVSKPSPPKVVQGSASQIKLIQKQLRSKYKLINVQEKKSSEPTVVNIKDKKQNEAIIVNDKEIKQNEPTFVNIKDKKQNEPTNVSIKDNKVNQHDESTTLPTKSNVHLPMDPPIPPIHAKDAPSFMRYMDNSFPYPKGVPKSFLRQQQYTGSIEPQGQKEVFNAFWNPNMYEEPGLHINTALPENNENPVLEQQYSPSDVYDKLGLPDETEGSLSPESSGQKRLSAFRRLGPVSQPKKPKLTINLLCNQDHSIREVLEDEVKTYTPVHLRKDVLESNDETVMKFLPYWPWKRNVGARKKVTARNSKSVMIMEQEQMEEIYNLDNQFIQVKVTGYPPFWKKEHVLDVILDAVKGKSFIPCFIEFTAEECKFLVIRSRSALIAIHKLGFYIRKDDVELAVTIYQMDLTLKQIDFIPRLVLRKQLAIEYDGERKLSLKEFTLKSDVSHFIYFPLNRGTNQTELVQLQSTVAWDFLTDLDLSHNRLTSIDGFELPKMTPKLKHLDLSYNWIDKVACLLHNRGLALRSLKLEGNPLCHDYIDPGHYVRVVKMIFPALTELDGVKIHLKGDLPETKRNFCPPDAMHLVDKFLEVFFPLLETPADERLRIEDMYDVQAVLTVTYRYALRYSALHRKFRNIFLRARVFNEGDEETIDGAPAIAKLISKWPMMFHDPYTFTVDVMHYSEFSTIIRVDGVLKLTSDTLAEDEHLLAFSRTLVLNSIDGVAYKIMNEMVYWDEPSKELANVAFQFNTIRTYKRLSFKLDPAPDDELKSKLTEIFMQISGLDKRSSERCLDLKEWNLKTSLEYFMKLVKLDDLSSLRRELEKDKKLL